MDYHTGLDVEAYQQAWKLASIRYPILRTAFDWDDQVLQVISSEASLGKSKFTVVDISDVPEGERDARIVELQRADRRVGFDLTQPGLMRFTLIRHSDELWTVLRSEHHSIADGWSGPLLMQTVHGYYQQLRAGESPVVEPQQSYLNAMRYYADQKPVIEAYWSQAKQNYGPTNDINALLSQRIDLSQSSLIDEPSEQVLTVSEDTHASIKRMCQRQGVTLNVALQFAWHKLLHTYTGDDQTIVGATVSGRDIPVDGIESSVGLSLIHI